MRSPQRQNAGLDNADNKRYFSIFEPGTHDSIIDQFRQKMRSVGIHYSGEIIADDKLHRFHVEGHKRCSLNGAYVIHLDGCPSVSFMDYKSGISQTWRSGNVSNITYDLTQQIKEAKLQREAETRQKTSRGSKEG